MNKLIKYPVFNYIFLDLELKNLKKCLIIVNWQI